MGDRATGLDFLEMIEHRSPSFRSSIDNGVDKKLKEVSLREHFPEVSDKLEQLLKDLEDYDSKYIELATRIEDYLLKSSIITKDRVGVLAKARAPGLRGREAWICIVGFWVVANVFHAFIL